MKKILTIISCLILTACLATNQERQDTAELLTGLGAIISQ